MYPVSVNGNSENHTDKVRWVQEVKCHVCEPKRGCNPPNGHHGYRGAKKKKTTK